MSSEVEQSAAKEAAARSGILTGRYDHALDPKKRLTIPRGWRRAMGDPEFVYVMPDRKEKCVNLLPKAEMDALLARVREKALFDTGLNKVLQVIGSMSEQLELDVQGRIRISDRLLRFANLTGVVSMVGAVRMVKIWDPAALAPEGEVDQASLDAALQEAGL